MVLGLGAACGGGGGGSSGGTGGTGGGSGQAVPTADYFPLATGNRWLWRSATSGQAVLRVLDQRSVSGQQAWLVVTEDDEGSDNQFVTSTGTAVRVVPDPTDPFAVQVGAYDLLRFPLRVGDRFTQVDRSLSIDVNADGRLDSVTIRSEVTVSGLESLVTQVGTLDNVLHTTTRTVTTVTLGGGLGSGEGTVVQDDWYAPGLGPVRTDVTTSIQGGPTTSDSRTLVGYSVNGRRSDSLAPGIRSMHPAHQARRSPMSEVRVTFDEVMDTFSLRNSGLQVQRADGTVVPGRLQWTAQTLSFVPTGFLTAGQYTVRVTGPWLDAAGNAVAGPLSWSFSIADDGLPVAALSPLPNAVDVPLSGVITITFDDEVDPATLTGNITLSDARAFVELAVQVSGRVVTLTPLSALERTNQYVLSVSPGIRDRFGNAINDAFSSSFLADGGAFASFTRLYDSDTSTARNGIADMNGDGRADLVTLATPIGTSGPLLYVLYQRLDGSLGPPVQIPRTLAPRNGSICGASDFVLRDMNGDGRMDIVLVAQSCGVEVLLQAADGSWPHSHFVDLPNARRVQVADLDGDGVPDLLASSLDSVWRWKGRGDAAPSLLAPLSFSTIVRDFVVADLDGDGRPDVITLLNTRPMEAAWRLQAPDGSFGAEQRQVVHDGAFGGALAVGDVTGDGRADIVASREGNSPTYLALLRQQPDGSFSTAEQLPTYDIPTALLLVDLNRDGKLDIVVGHSVWLRVGVYFSDGSGVLGAETLYRAEYQDFEPGSIAAGDLNGDGLIDLMAGKNFLRQKTIATASAFRVAPHSRGKEPDRPPQQPADVVRGVLCIIESKRTSDCNLTPSRLQQR